MKYLFLQFCDFVIQYFILLLKFLVLVLSVTAEKVSNI